MAIAPRIVRRGVNTASTTTSAAPVTPAADLANELAASNTVASETPEESVEGAPEEEVAVTPTPTPVTAPKVLPKVAVAQPAETVAAALDKAAKEDSKKISPMPKKVVINRGPKEEKPLEDGDQITRDAFFRMFQGFLTSYSEMDFSGITLAQARRFFEALEKFVGEDVINHYRCNLFGFLFKHEQKKGSFREPKDIIFYNGPHLEITARKIFEGITAAVMVNKDASGKIISVEAGKMTDGQFVADKELSKIVVPEYYKHLEASFARLEADDAKAAARAAKLQERASALLQK
jgi:hypothetical protein